MVDAPALGADAARHGSSSLPLGTFFTTLPMTHTKTLLLVGPGEHFGKHIIRRFASEGFVIGVISRNEEHLQQLVSDMESESISIISAVADVSDKERVTKAVGAVQEKLGDFSCVIFNVKYSVRGSCLSIATELLRDSLNTNVVGAVNVIQAVHPYLNTVESASIILTGGGYKDTPDSEKVALSIAKGALHTLTMAAAQTLVSQNIFVKTVVIDGVVREDGPLFSRDAADAFWSAYCDNNVTVFPFPSIT